MNCRFCQELVAMNGNGEIGVAAERHLDQCSDCRIFQLRMVELEQIADRVPAPAPADLVERTLAQMRPALAARRRIVRSLHLRLAIAGTMALPVILLANAGFVWLVSEALGHFVYAPLGQVAAGASILSTLLGLSLFYGALPLVANWGVELRMPETT